MAKETHRFFSHNENAKEQLLGTRGHIEVWRSQLSTPEGQGRAIFNAAMSLLL